MNVGKEEALRQLNLLISNYSYSTVNGVISDMVEREKYAHYLIRMTTALERLAPPGSRYLDFLLQDETNLEDLVGAVKALRSDYEDDAMWTFRELVNAELEDDFLSMSEFLLQDEKLKQPAAVLAGGVLEEHIRKLCSKHGIDTTLDDKQGNPQPKKADTMNADLRKGGFYNVTDQKQVTAWLGVRNHAAHAEHDKYDERDVELMINWLRHFISKYPA